MSLHNNSLQRILVVFFAVSLSSLGIALYYSSALGADPCSVFIDGLHESFNISHGKALNIFNAVVLLVLLLVAFKHIHLGVLVSLACSGTLVNFFNFVISLIPTDSTLVFQVIYLCFGLVFLSVGTGVFLSAGMGAGPWDTILYAVSVRFKIKFRYVRIVSDLFFASIGFFLGGTIGVGTVATLIVVGYMIEKSFHISNNTLMKIINRKALRKDSHL